MFPLYRELGIPFDIAYGLSAWSAWIINLGLFFGWQYRRAIGQFFGGTRQAAKQEQLQDI